MTMDQNPEHIHALFIEMRRNMLLPPPTNPTRGQINAFSRLLREETHIPPDALTEESVYHAWYFTQDKLHLNAAGGPTEHWHESQWIGWQAAVLLDRACQPQSQGLI